METLFAPTKKQTIGSPHLIATKQTSLVGFMRGLGLNGYQILFT